MSVIIIWVPFAYGCIFIFEDLVDIKKHYFSNGNNIHLGYGDIKLSKGDVKLLHLWAKSKIASSEQTLNF